MHDNGAHEVVAQLHKVVSGFPTTTTKTHCVKAITGEKRAIMDTPEASCENTRHEGYDFCFETHTQTMHTHTTKISHPGAGAGAP